MKKAAYLHFDEVNDISKMTKFISKEEAVNNLKEIAEFYTDDFNVIEIEALEIELQTIKTAIQNPLFQENVKNVH